MVETQQRPLWSHPNPGLTNIEAFRHYVNKCYSLDLRNYQALYDWSVADIEAFAEACWVFCGVKHSAAPEKTVSGANKLWPPPKWFPGARLNFTENLLSLGVATKPDAVALTVLREDASQREDITWLQLQDEVRRYASLLRAVGIKIGDRVASVLTESKDAICFSLAATALGAIFSSTAPDMGESGIIDRYSQLRPKVFVCETEVVYAGKRRDLRQKFFNVAQQLQLLVPEFETTVIAGGPRFQGDSVFTADQLFSIVPSDTHLEYEQLPFDHPIYVLYSSGTSGPPKCICHSAGGTLLMHKKEQMLHMNLSNNSVYFHYTTTGWMMWNYLVSALSVGARLVLYDGSPMHPKPTSQLEILVREKVTDWGTSPKFLAALRQHGFDEGLNLEPLRAVHVTGSPLSVELYHWFYSKFPRTVRLSSGSGGTDLVGGIVVGSPINDVFPGEIGAAALGMKVEIWDEDGRSIGDSGEKGELVITKPFFSMPLTFYGQNGADKYYNAYFKKFPGVWSHGDYIKKSPSTGGYEILGRSDGVLNPAGIRFGTAELYSVVDKFAEIEDAVAVGQKIGDGSDEHVLLFVKMKPATSALTNATIDAIRTAVKTILSPRHVPKHIHQVADIPYTVNGKKVENLVRDVVAGKKVTPSSTVANPECLDEYRRFGVLRYGDSRPKL